MYHAWALTRDRTSVRRRLVRTVGERVKDVQNVAKLSLLVCAIDRVSVCLHPDIGLKTDRATLASTQ